MSGNSNSLPDGFNSSHSLHSPHSHSKNSTGCLEHTEHTQHTEQKEESTDESLDPRKFHDDRLDWPWLVKGQSTFTRTPILRDKYRMTEEEIQFIQNHIIDRQTQHRIMNIPQRTDEWLKVRKHRITASNYGSAVGHNQYSNQNQLMKEMLWHSFKGNAATEWGTKYESKAADLYLRFMQQKYPGKKIELTFPGLIVSLEHPWAGSSPDGFVWIDGKLVGGIEIKCPFRKRLYPYIPSYYYDQIQGSMGFLHMDWWDFIVWTPDQSQIQRFPFDANYWNNELFPKLEDFYMRQYVPKALLQEKGKLKTGAIEEEPLVDLDIDIGSMGVVGIDLATVTKSAKKRRIVAPASAKFKISAVPGVFSQSFSFSEPDVPEGFNFE